MISSASFVRRTLSKVNSAKKALARAETKHAQALERYAKRRPLTEAEHRAIVARVMRGRPICCAGGLRWLRSRVPELWAVSLNSWAYQALSCKGMRESDIPDHADKVRRLSRFRFPLSGA